MIASKGVVSSFFIHVDLLQSA